MTLVSKIDMGVIFYVFSSFLIFKKLSKTIKKIIYFNIIIKRGIPHFYNLTFIVMANNFFTEEQILKHISKPLKIAEAIYSITKEMKKQRDFMTRILNTSKEKNSLSKGTPWSVIYNYYKDTAECEEVRLAQVKNFAISELWEKFKIEPIGHCNLNGTEKNFYEIGRFEFYSDSHFIQGKSLWIFNEDWRLDEKSMSFEKAMHLLNRFFCDQENIYS